MTSLSRYSRRFDQKKAEAKGGCSSRTKISVLPNYPIRRGSQAYEIRLDRMGRALPALSAKLAGYFSTTRRVTEWLASTLALTCSIWRACLLSEAVPRRQSRQRLKAVKLWSPMILS